MRRPSGADRGSCALVGITGLKRVVFGGIKPLYKVPVELFDTRAAGRDWLVAR